MIAKMPMTSSPEKRRDCIAQVPLRVTSTGILACPKILVISAKKLFRLVSLEVNCHSGIRRAPIREWRHDVSSKPPSDSSSVSWRLLWFLYQYPCQVSQKID